MSGMVTDEVDAAAIIAGLGGNRDSGMCCCPAHDDSTPSLHIGAGRNGKILVRCHAGCSQEQVIAALKAKGLWSGGSHKQTFVSDPTKSEAYDAYVKLKRAWAILRAANAANAGSPKRYLKGRKIDIVPKNAMMLSASQSRKLMGFGFSAMVLPIANDGLLSGCLVTFLARDSTRNVRSDGKSLRRIFGKRGCVQLSKCKSDTPLIIGEGVESTLSMMQITGLPGIAGCGTAMASLQPPPCSKIIIAADNDQAGLKAANALAQRLADSREYKSVRIAIPEIEGYDWNDVLRTDGVDLDKLRERIFETERIRPERRVRAVTARQFMNLKFPKREMLLHPWLPVGSISMIYAERGGGKTWLVLAVAYSVATGEDLLGWTCERKGRVLYFDGELPGRFLQKRLSFLGPLPNDLLILSRDQFHARQKLMPDIGTVEGRRELDQIIEAHDPDLIIFDSISTLVRSGEENDATGWAPIADWLMSHRWKGRSTILVHHEGRSGKPRGTSKREDILDTMINLANRVPKPGEEVNEYESVFDLNYTKHRDFFGPDAAPLVMRLTTKSGKAEWEVEAQAEDLRSRIVKFLKAGWKQRDIAKELGVTEGRVSQLKPSGFAKA
jgi:putative DNA primase/helicase